MVIELKSLPLVLEVDIATLEKMNQHAADGTTDGEWPETRGPWKQPSLLEDLFRIPALIDTLAQVPDFRKAQGKRHPLKAMLALASVALLCGYRSPLAISEWAVNYGLKYLHRLGFKRKRPPGQATWYRVLGGIDWQALEDKLSCWAERVLAVLGSDDEWEAVALDGKTLRGSKKQGAAEAHLLSALSHRWVITLGQIAVADKTNEIGAIRDLLIDLVMEGRVFTVDALLTQRNVADIILGGQSGYVFVVKRNQPTLYQDIKLLFDAPPEMGFVTDVAEQVNAGHGRIERRRLTTSTALNDYLDWPGVQQVFCLERTFIRKKTGKVTTKVVYGVTSLTSEEATAMQLLILTRQHWHIENKSHWVRDVTFDEDLSQVRAGNLPHVMAALRNTVISLLRATGATNIAAALRYYAAHPDEALALIGLPA
jgi:predicted transposase YbfD/YdcC